MLRVIRSTAQGLDIDTNLEDDYSTAAQAGTLLRESHSSDNALTIELRSYTDPADQNRFVVLYTDPTEIHWQDTADYTEARNQYEEGVREAEKGAALDVDEDGNEKPLFATTDVRGVAGYEEGSEESGDAEALLLVAEWATAGAEEAQRVFDEKTRARQIAYARAIDNFGRGGQAVLARRVGLREPTVKDITDRGRALLAGVTVYEDNAGQVYLRRDGADHYWYLGVVTADMHGRFADDAEGWIGGDWEPNEDDGQGRHAGEPHEGLVRVGSWSSGEGVKVARRLNGDIEAGAGGRLYLGVGEDSEA